MMEWSAAENGVLVSGFDGRASGSTSEVVTVRVIGSVMAMALLLAIGVPAVAQDQGQDLDTSWSMTGQQLIDRLVTDHGYGFGESAEYPGAAWYGPQFTTEDEGPYGGSGTLVVFPPFDGAAHVLTKADLISNDGERHLRRLFGLLIPDKTDQGLVLDAYTDTMNRWSDREDRLSRPAYGQQVVPGGAVHMSYVITDYELLDHSVPVGPEGPLSDPYTADDWIPRGGLAFEFVPDGLEPIEVYQRAAANPTSTPGPIPVADGLAAGELSTDAEACWNPYRDDVGNEFWALPVDFAVEVSNRAEVDRYAWVRITPNNYRGDALVPVATDWGATTFHPVSEATYDIMIEGARIRPGQDATLRWSILFPTVDDVYYSVAVMSGPAPTGDPADLAAISPDPIASWDRHTSFIYACPG